MSNEIPPEGEEDMSRNPFDTEQMVPAERAIYDAMGPVEDLGAHPLLTEAVSLLDQAKRKVSEFVDQADHSDKQP